MIVKNRFKAVLKAKKMKAIELARELGVTKSTMSKWCTNRHQPNFDVAVKIAFILEVDIHELYEIIEE